MAADPWLGPDVGASLLDVARQKATDVVFCPIGFLSDHIEILYDLDIEAKARAKEAGPAYARTAAVNGAAELPAPSPAAAPRPHRWTEARGLPPWAGCPAEAGPQLTGVDRAARRGP